MESMACTFWLRYVELILDVGKIMDAFGRLPSPPYPPSPIAMGEGGKIGRRSVNAVLMTRIAFKASTRIRTFWNEVSMSATVQRARESWAWVTMPRGV